MHTLPNLPFSYDALEPYIDAKTMEIHHSKHHQAYVNNLNIALENHKELQEISVEDLLKNTKTLPEDIKQAVINNGGGHFNHSFFWQVLSPKSSKEPVGSLKSKLEESFGSFETFKAKFTETATKRFGSGWAWLVKTGENNLEVYSTANQDSPISEGKTPLLCIDVWEHAYYLKYQNRRPEYIEAWWNVVNWEKMEELYLRN
jgi:superoxide dismutase, Fe-Mn family